MPATKRPTLASLTALARKLYGMRAVARHNPRYASKAGFNPPPRTFAGEIADGRVVEFSGDGAEVAGFIMGAMGFEDTI